MHVLALRACRIPVLAFLMGSIWFLSGCNEISDKDIVFSTMAEVRAATMPEKAGTVRLIDPRAPEDFAAGHIPRAENLQLPHVSARKGSTVDPRLAAFKTLIVYGNDPGSGVAKAMAKRMMTAGYKGVKMYSGGLEEWMRTGQPVERGDSQTNPHSISPGR